MTFRHMELLTMQNVPKEVEALNQQRENLEGAVKESIEHFTKQWNDKFDSNAAKSVMFSSSIFFA